MKQLSICEKYARDVVSGKQLAGKLIIKAAARFLKDLKRKDIYWDEKEAIKIVNFAQRYLNLWEDEWRGKPVVILPWMAFILMQIYGWIKVEDGKRRVRKVYVQVSKKNAKTTLASIIAAYHLLIDDRINTPNIYVGANNEDQAKLCVNITGKIIEQSPKLKVLIDNGTIDLFRYKEKIVRIVHHDRDGFITPMAKEPAKTDTAQSGGKHGINPSLAIVDEYSAADSDNFLNTMESAQAARSEPLQFIITTAGHKKNGPCFLKLRKTGIDILEGVIEDDSYLAFIYELDEGDEYSNLKVAIKCNPSLGVTVQVSYLKARILAAKNEGGTKEVDVRTYTFNEWVDSPEVFIPSDTWKANGRKTSKESVLSGMVCYGGIEIISGLDLNAFALYFPDFKEDIDALKFFFWMAEGKVINNKMKMDCSKFVKGGHIKTTPGDVIDNEFIYQTILEEVSNFNMHSMAFNINLQNHEIMQGLINASIECNPISQSYRGLSEPTKAWEELLTGKKIEHFNNPVLTWMNSNCLVIRKETDIRLMKTAGRIAGISAAIHALAQYKIVTAEEEKDQVIESW